MSTSEMVSDVSERPARFPWRRVMVALGVLVAVLVVVGFLWQWLGGPTTYGPLRKLHDALDASDPGWRLSEMEEAREQVPEANNSARVAMQAERLMPRSWPTQAFDQRFVNLDHSPTTRLDEERAGLLAREMAGLAPSLARARRLAQMPHGRHHLTMATNPIETLLEDQQKTRRIASLLRYDALHRAEKGDLRGALESCRAGVNAGRSLGDEPFVISQFIRIACLAVAFDMVERVLAQGEATEADLAALQKLLEEEEKHPTLLVAVRGERAVLDDLFTKLGDGTLTMESLTRSGVIPSSDAGLIMRLVVFSPGRVRRDHVLTLELMNQGVDIARLPAHEQGAASDRMMPQVRSLPIQAVLTRLLIPATTRTVEATRRKTAQVRSLMTLVAVERYRLKKGKWPASLEELKPDFLAQVPLDPFDGKPLRSVKRPDGVTVYSVGQDGVDNGGKIDRSKPMSPGVDLGYRLWDVKSRRQAPPG
jgi:hypothetical protein